MALLTQYPQNYGPVISSNPVTGEPIFGGTTLAPTTPGQNYSSAVSGAFSGYTPTPSVVPLPPPPAPVAPAPTPSLTEGLTFGGTTPTTAPGQKTTAPASNSNLLAIAGGLNQAGKGVSADGKPQFSAIGGGLGAAGGTAIGGPVGGAVGGAAGSVAGGLLDWWLGAREREEAEKAEKRKEAETRRWQELYMIQERKAQRQGDQRFANEMSSAELEATARKRQVAEAFKASIQGILQRRANRAGYGVADNVVSSPIGQGPAATAMQGAF